MIQHDDFLHFEFRVGSLLFDARPLFAAIRNAESAGRVQFPSQTEKILGELSLHLATRSNLLVLCLRYLDDALKTAVNSAAPGAGDQSLRPLADEAIYSLLLFIDSFLFESFAYMEVLEKFVKRVLIDVLRVSPPEARRTFAKVRDRSGRVGRKTWMAFLSSVRNHFSHAATPWFAVDRRRRKEGIYDIVIMHENITDFAEANPDKYFSAVTDLNAAWEGLMNTAANCHECLLSLLN